MSEDLSALIARARKDNDLSALVGLIPYAGFLGLSVDARDGRLVTTMAYSEQNVGNAALPALHGGTIGALLESAAIFELLWSDPEGLPKTITLTIDYLRSGRPLDTHAQATVIRRGRRVATVRVEAWQDDPDQPIATAVTHLLLTARQDTDP